MATHQHATVFSTFLRDPKSVTDQLHTGAVVVHRRDGDDFVIEQLEHHINAALGTEIIADSIRRVSREDLRPIAASIESRFPWTRYLSPSGREQFIAELTDTLAAGAALGNFAELPSLIHHWLRTAEIRADPTLARALSTPIEDPTAQPVPAIQE